MANFNLIVENRKENTNRFLNIENQLNQKIMSKAIVTIGILIGFFFLFGVIVFANRGSVTPGFLGLILFAGLIAGLRAVWKKPAAKNEITEMDEHQLDKRN